PRPSTSAHPPSLHDVLPISWMTPPSARCSSKAHGWFLHWASITLTGGRRIRSEEHTSELQSRAQISYAVFCLKKQPDAPRAPIVNETFARRYLPNTDPIGQTFYI